MKKIVLILCILSACTTFARRVVDPRRRQEQHIKIEDPTQIKLAQPTTDTSPPIEVSITQEEQTNIAKPTAYTAPIVEASIQPEDQMKLGEQMLDTEPARFNEITQQSDIQSETTTVSNDEQPFPFGIDPTGYQHSIINTALHEMRSTQTVNPLVIAWNNGGGLNNPDRAFVREALSIVMQIRKHFR